MKKYLKATELAEQLSISRRQILRLAQEGTLPSLKLGGRVMFPAERVQTVLDRLERDGRRKRRGAGA